MSRFSATIRLAVPFTGCTGLPGGELIDPGKIFDEMPEEQGIAGSASVWIHPLIDEL